MHTRELFLKLLSLPITIHKQQETAGADAYFDSYGWLDGSSSWVSPLNNDVPEKEIKIILCNSFLATSIFNEVEILLFRLFLRFADVYLWKQKFQLDDVPLTDLNSFFDQSLQIKTATKKVVQDALGEYAKDFIVIDAEAWQYFLEKYVQLTNISLPPDHQAYFSPLHFDATHFYVNSTDYITVNQTMQVMEGLESEYREKIEILTVVNYPRYLSILKFFPNCKEIRIILDDLKSKDDRSEDYVRFLFPDVKVTYVPHPVSGPSPLWIKTKENEHYTFTILKDLSITVLDLQEQPGLEFVAIRDCPQLTTIQWPINSTIRKLHISHCPLLRLESDIQNLNYLQELSWATTSRTRDLSEIHDIPSSIPLTYEMFPRLISFIFDNHYKFINYKKPTDKRLMADLLRLQSRPNDCAAFCKEHNLLSLISVQQMIFPRIRHITDLSYQQVFADRWSDLDGLYRLIRNNLGLLDASFYKRNNLENETRQLLEYEKYFLICEKYLKEILTHMQLLVINDKLYREFTSFEEKIFHNQSDIYCFTIFDFTEEDPSLNTKEFRRRIFRVFQVTEKSVDSLELARHNNFRTNMRFARLSSHSVSHDTTPLKNPVRDHGNDIVEFFSSQPVRAGTSQIDILDPVYDVGNKKLNFICYFNDYHNLEELKINYQMINPAWVQRKQAEISKTQDVLVYYKTRLIYNNNHPYYSCPLPHALAKKEDIEIYFSGNLNVIQVFRHVVRKHIYVKLNSLVDTDIILYYSVKRNEKYEHEIKSICFNVPLQKKIPHKLREELKRQIESIAPLQFGFMFDLKLDNKEKFNKLKEYFFNKKFKNVPLSQASNNDIEMLVRAGAEETGRCSQTSQLLFLLLRLINGGCNLVRTPEHMYLQLSGYDEKKSLQLYRMDVGGAPLVNHADPVPSVFQSNLSNSPLPTVLPPLKKQSEVGCYAEIKTKFSQKKLTQLKQLLQEDRREIQLICISTNQQFFNRKILSELKENNLSMDNYLYIHSEAEWRQFFASMQLVNNKKQKNTNGFLARLVQGKGILILDLSTFNPRQIAIYENVWAEMRKQGVLLIMLSHSNQEQFELSFCTEWAWQEEHKEEKKMEMDGTSFIEVNLFYQPFWRDFVFGKIGKNNLGALGNAKERNCELRIINPPKNNPKFDEFVARVNDEGRYFNPFVGDIEKLPSEVRITVIEKDFTLSLPQQVNLSSSDETLKDQKRIYFSMSNFYQLIQQIEEKNTDKWKNSYFYVLEEIPETYWKYLLYCIGNQNEKITFVLAPAVTLSGVVGNKANSRPMDLTVIVSNDTDYTSKLLEEKYQGIGYPVTPQQGDADFFYERKAASDELCFISIEKDCLKNLKQNKTVILNGNIAPSFYRFLFTQPVDLIKKLILVLPHTVLKKNFLFGYQEEINYTLTDYKNIFIKENKANEKLFAPLERFFNKLLAWPHRGMGRPSGPRVSHVLLQRILHKFKKWPKQYHKNILDRAVNLNYPLQSEDYAYLSVWAKIYFFPNDNEDKNNQLLELRDQQNIKDIPALRPFFYRVANCLDGKKLVSILENDELSEEKLYGIIQAAKYVEEKKLDYSVQQKMQQEEIQHQLQDPETSMVFLKGKAGGGKTHAATELVKTGTYEFIDEFNLLPPGNFDYLKNKKCILTGNFEIYHGRFYHLLAQDYADIFILTVDKDFFHYALLCKLPDRYKKHVEKFLAVYDLVEKENESFVISFRTAQALSEHFVYFIENEKLSVARAILKSCELEFGCVTADVDQQQVLLQKFKKIILTEQDKKEEKQELKSIIEISPGCIVPTVYDPVIQLVRHTLLLRKYLLQQGKVSCKPAVLIQSLDLATAEFILISILDKENCTYTNINAAHPDWVREKGKEVMEKGQIAVLKNGQYEKERILNNFLYGLGARPGFSVFYLAENCSPATRNRMTPVNVPEMKEKEIKDVAVAKEMNANDFYESYERARNEKILGNGVISVFRIFNLFDPVSKKRGRENDSSVNLQNKRLNANF